MNNDEFRAAMDWWMYSDTMPSGKSNELIT